MKKFYILFIVLLAVVAMPVFAEEATTTQPTCPLFMPPGPNFCVGGSIVGGELDGRGCPRPPRCVRTGPGATGTVRDGEGDRGGPLFSGPRFPTSSASSVPPMVRELKDRRDAFLGNVQSLKDKFKQEIEAKREEMQKEIEAKKAELKQRLLGFKDKVKQQVVLRLGTNMTDLNTRMVDNFSGALDKLDQVLTSVSSRADKAEANGKDVSAVRTAITAAQGAIAAARALVSTQSGKVYSINVQSESTVKADASSTKQLLEADLKAVQAGVRAAREAVGKTLQALTQIPGVDSEETTSTTP